MLNRLRFSTVFIIPDKTPSAVFLHENQQYPYVYPFIIIYIFKLYINIILCFSANFAQGKFARVFFANARTRRLYAVLIKSLCKNINHSIKISKYTHAVLSNNQFVRIHSSRTQSSIETHR